MKERVQTTDDCLMEARAVLRAAKQVSTRQSHEAIKAQANQLTNIINNAFETGYFLGKPYDDLREAKSTIHMAQTLATERAYETYKKEMF